MTRTLIALVLVGVAACSGDDAATPDAPPGNPDAAGNLETINLPLGGPVPVDVLLVVDNSGSMRPYQAQLAAAIHRLTEELGAGGVLPDIHVGVVTSDLGSLGVSTGDAACSDSDDGRLVTSGCAGIDPADSFLTDVLDGATGGRTRNYAGALEQAVACMVEVGNGGCGFEQHLEAMRLALAQPGFVRAEADLVVLVFGDEDDCSAFNPAFFGPESPALGPLDSFRCFEQGVRCNPDDPRAEGVKSGCVSREDSAYLHPVSRYTDFLAGLKPDQRVMVGAITGPASPVEVGRRTPSGSTTPRPDVLESCSFDLPAGGGTLTADPGVRLAQFATTVTGSQVAGRMCATDYPALTELGTLAHATAVGNPCFISSAVDAMTGGDIEGECQVTLTVPGEGTGALAACDATASNEPCWRIQVDATVCSGSDHHHRLDVVLATAPLQGTRVTATCHVH